MHCFSKPGMRGERECTERGGGECLLEKEQGVKMSTAKKTMINSSLCFDVPAAASGAAGFTLQSMCTLLIHKPISLLLSHYDLDPGTPRLKYTCLQKRN